jgi:hypothetical protein
VLERSRKINLGSINIRKNVAADRPELFKIELENLWGSDFPTIRNVHMKLEHSRAKTEGIQHQIGG